MGRMAPRDLVGFVLAVAFAGLTILSMDRWSAAAEVPEPGLFYPLMPADEAEAAAATTPELRRLKRAFVDAAGVFELHNEVFEGVGRERWEAEVSPAMYRSLLGRMVLDTGIVIPTDEQMIDWAKQNPDSVREVVRSYLPKPE